MLGLGASDAEVEKAAGVNANLWTGLAMLIVAGIFIAWALARPMSAQLDEAESDEPGSGPGRD